MIPKKLHYLYIATNEQSDPINPNHQGICYNVGKFDCSVSDIIYPVRLNASLYIQWLVERSVQKHKEQGWEIFLWTNNKAYIPHTAHFMENLGVPTLEIGQYIKNVTRPINEVTNFKPQTSTQSGNMVDLAKYLVAEEVGGLSIDFDWLINKPLTDELLSRYDAITVGGGENYFFAFAPHHRSLISLIDSYDRDRECMWGTPDNFYQATREHAKNTLFLGSRCGVVNDQKDIFGIDLHIGSWRDVGENQ